MAVWHGSGLVTCTLANWPVQRPYEMMGSSSPGDNPAGRLSARFAPEKLALPVISSIGNMLGPTAELGRPFKLSVRVDFGCNVRSPLTKTKPEALLGGGFWNGSGTTRVKSKPAEGSRTTEPLMMRERGVLTVPDVMVKEPGMGTGLLKLRLVENVVGPEPVPVQVEPLQTKPDGWGGWQPAAVGGDGTEGGEEPEGGTREAGSEAGEGKAAVAETSPRLAGEPGMVVTSGETSVGGREGGQAPLVSQPLVTPPSQLLNPPLQPPISHTPAKHSWGETLARLQTIPQPLQSFVSVRMLVYENDQREERKK